MLDKYLSEKIKVISFILIILVVYLHSYNLVINMGSSSETIDYGFNAYIQYFISYGITRIAVPIFFIISGFLFFFKDKVYTFKEYKIKIIKRTKTLFIPYLFWSITGIVLYFFLQTFHFSKPFFTNLLIKDYNLYDFLDKIFFNPIPYQFWFIRDLMIFVFISPLIYYLLKRVCYILLFMLFLGWIIDFNYIIISNESILFFTLGAYITLFNKSIILFKNRSYIVLVTFLWIVLLIIKTFLYFSFSESHFFISFLHKAAILIGIFSIWGIYDLIKNAIDLNKTILYKLLHYTFFIYAFHEPVLTVYKKAFYFFMGKTELSSFLIYIFAPLLVILTAIFVASILNKHFSYFYKMVTGDR